MHFDFTQGKTLLKSLFFKILSAGLTADSTSVLNRFPTGVEKVVENYSAQCADPIAPYGGAQCAHPYALRAGGKLKFCGWNAVCAPRSARTHTRFAQVEN